MEARIIVSEYVISKYNKTKLEKLKLELQRLCSAFETREHQQYPKEGILINVSMSAKYGTLYIKVSEWEHYQAVGEFEDLVTQALENRGFEAVANDGDEDYFKITFE